MADIRYEIKEKVGIIAESAKGWKKELNLITWNGNEAKYYLENGLLGMKKWEKVLH